MAVTGYDRIYRYGKGNQTGMTKKGLFRLMRIYDAKQHITNEVTALAKRHHVPKRTLQKKRRVETRRFFAKDRQ